MTKALADAAEAIERLGRRFDAIAARRADAASYPCFKCGGGGKIGAFAHIEGGECFQCGGSGKLSYQPKPKAPRVEPHPEWVIPEGQRATIKQWEYLDKLCGDTDTKARLFLKQAGAPLASEPYVSKAMISKAIDFAREARPVPVDKRLRKT